MFEEKGYGSVKISEGNGMKMYYQKFKVVGNNHTIFKSDMKKSYQIIL